MHRETRESRESGSPQRRTAQLRIGRVSAVGAVYFVTAVTKDRQRVLHAGPIAERIVGAWDSMHVVGDWELLAATVMPDHVHLLFVLGSRLQLGRAIAKFKALARGGNSAAWRWQEEVFEHRLRPQESTERYGRYVFMNPYVASLLGREERWPWWRCPSPTRFLFMGGLKANGGPVDEWFGDDPPELGPLITGE